MSRARNLAGFASAVENPQNPVNIQVGYVTAIAYYGDGSELTGTPGGLGTSLLPTDLNSPLNKIYYTNQNLSIASTITVDPPASAKAAYTQYPNILVQDDADLIVADGDDFIPDILGIGTDVDSPGALAGGNGKLRVDNVTNKAGVGAPTFPYGQVTTGVATATQFSGNYTGTASTITTATVTGTLTLSDGVPSGDTVYYYNSTANGLIRRYYAVDSLNSGQSTRLTFRGADRAGCMITINAVGDYGSSNTGNNHVAAQFMTRVFTNSSGDSTDSSTAATIFAYTYALSDYTFTNSGSDVYTIDIQNPTGDPSVSFSYEVIIQSTLQGSHRLTASSTV